MILERVRLGHGGPPVQLWVIRCDFRDDEGRVTARWWLDEPDAPAAFGEVEDAARFGRRIDAEAAYRSTFSRLAADVRAQRVEEALAEVQGVPARLSGTTERDNASGQDAAPVVVSAGGGAP